MPKYLGTVRDQTGRILRNATVHVYDPGTTTHATIYSEETLTTTKSNPLKSDGDGNIEFFAQTGEYDLQVKFPGFPSLTFSDVHVGAFISSWLELDNTTAPGDPTSGVRMYAESDALKSVDPSGNVATYPAQGAGATGFYDPNKPPASGLDAAVSDEFLDGASITWDWQNQMSSVNVEEMDGMMLEAPASSTGWTANDFSILWGPDVANTGIDHTFVVNMQSCASEGNAMLFGIALLTGGTKLSPTEIVLVLAQEEGGHNLVRKVVPNYSTDAAETKLADFDGAKAAEGGQPVFLMIQHDQSAADELDFRFSRSGRVFRDLSATLTPAGPPKNIGLVVAPEVNTAHPITQRAFYRWVRVFESLTTDVGALA